MAVVGITLPIGSAILPDGSSGNATPAISQIQGTESNPKKHFLGASFDPTTDQHLWWSFQMPSDYVSGGTVRLLWYANATTGTCRWGARLGAITPADTDTPIEHAEAAASTAGTAANTTEAKRLVETQIALGALDSVSAGDLVCLLVYRDADGTSGTDDLAVVSVLLNVMFEYTA